MASGPGTCPVAADRACSVPLGRRSGGSRPPSSAAATSGLRAKRPLRTAGSPPGATSGARAARLRSAARMSSGRTAGVICRTTIRSIAHPAVGPSERRAGQASERLTTAARASSRRSPLLVSVPLPRWARPGTPARPGAAASGVTPGRITSHWEASSRSRAGTWRPPRPPRSRQSRPAGPRRAVPDVGGLATAGQRDLQVLGLARGSRSAPRPDTKSSDAARTPRSRRPASRPFALPARSHARCPCGSRSASCLS